MVCRRLVRADASQCPEDGGAAEPVSTLPAGARLGAYRIERVLGDGGMGFVYEATHEVLNRRSAIKMLRPELAKLEQIVTRFLNEAKAVNLIDHQNIVNVYDYGDGQGGGVYFVMEYLEGETLDDLMHKRQPMAVPLLVHVFGQMVRALSAAHAKQIVHRDLKPANVFVVAREDNPYFIKLLDFGIAQLRGEGAVQGLTLAGSVMGTPQYMSPEQISGGTVDARTDVWAVGVMMYRAATGHAPFKGEEFAELADKIYNGTPIPAEQLAPMPPALARLIASCLERSADARCPSAAALLAGLEEVKRACGLDDDAILAAVRADVGAAAMALPGPREPTRESLAGSLPRYHGVPDAVARRAAAQGAGPAPRRSRLGLYLTLGAALGGLGSAGAVLLGRGEAAVAQTAEEPGSEPGSGPESRPGPVQPPAPGPAPAQQLEEAFRVRDLAKVRALAEQHLRDTLASGTLQQQGFAVDALASARVRAGAKLLYVALKKSPEIRVRAARALAELELPESAQKLRDALAVSGDRLKIELAAALYRLGGTDARAILRRALSDPGVRLVAALAMAEAGDEAGRAVLAEHLELPAGHEGWRRAAGGLVRLGDARARALLQGELSQADPARAVDAAERLARAGDANAHGMLARLVEDVDFERRGEAAVALARRGDRRALAPVAQGLASGDVDERKRALAVCGALAAEAAPHHEAIVGLAAGDPDPGVRLAAAAVLLGM